MARLEVTERARLFAGTWRPTLYYVAISFHHTVLHTFPALCPCSKFGHHPHPLGYLCVPNFVSFEASTADLTHGKNHVHTHSITHPVYLMHREPITCLTTGSLVILKSKVVTDTDLLVAGRSGKAEE